MKRKLLTLILAAAVVGIIPVYAYASNTTDYGKKSEEVITKQKVVTEVSEDGTETQLGLVTYEQQPDEESVAEAGCSGGNHLNVVNNEVSETTRIHGETHPGYCMLKTTTYWSCTACNTTGHDDQYSLVWCTSSEVSGDEGTEEAELS